MGDIVNEGPSRPTRHAIAKVAHISSVVHHAGHVEVEIVFTGCEFSEEGGSSASSSSAARCIVQVGEWGFLHLVGVVPPQGKAPHPVPRHASTPEKSNKDSSCTSDRQFAFQGQRNPWCPCKRHQLLLCPVLLNKRRSRSQCPAPCDECAGSPFKKKLNTYKSW